MYFILGLVLGLVVGAGLAWYLLEQQRQDEDHAREAQQAARLKQLQDEVAQADSAHAETKERLIALQLEHKKVEERARALEAEVERLKRAAGDGAAAPTSGPLLEPPAAGAEPAPAPAPGQDDLTRIKGIGKAMERKLHALGITSFRQLAELSPTEIERVNRAIDFPGRVERERWREQARELMGA